MNKSIEVNGTSVFILRVLLSGIFISAGLTHLIQPELITLRIEATAFNEFMGDPYLMGILSGIALLIGGFTLLLGVYTRQAALILFVVLIPITITIQMGNGLMHGPLWKNVALFGGLLFFIINNPNTYCLYHSKKKNYENI